MASKPGILTEWPWRPLGSFKYVTLAPLVVDSIHTISVNYGGDGARDIFKLLILPFLLWRILHNQIWISLSRYRTARGDNRIVDKGIEFDQVDRENNWDDQIILNGILFYIANKTFKEASELPMWRTDGVIITILLHIGPVEFIYYWFHRALHHHFLYSRYHSHHHSSIATEPITSVIHPFAEVVSYFLLFAIPMVTTLFNGTGSIAAYFGYITYTDFMNNMGHCNFEFIKTWFFSIFPPLKYLMYTPSFHSLHHTQFRTNYSLFMPIYDYIYGTMDNASDALFKTSVKRAEESPDVVHLTHLTTPESVYHLQFGFSSLASKPYTTTWYFWVVWPFTLLSTMWTSIYGRSFVVERNSLQSLRLQTWALPKYNFQYFMQWHKKSINSLIEEAILEAEERGIKVLSLGLLNQGEELNKYGEVYVMRHPKLKVKVVDGSSLAVAIVLNSIPEGTTQVLLRGTLTKVARTIASCCMQKGIQVATLHKDEYKELRLNNNAGTNLVHARSYVQEVWLVGDGLSDKEQMKASRGTLFIPISQFPPKKVREDCFYHTTPAMMAPMSLENMHSCENWLPRRVMSAWRIAGIVHALEGWNVDECGNNTIFSFDKVWQASLIHGFRPLSSSE